MSLDIDIDFLLSHFDMGNLFPRKMMTRSKNYQFTVYDKEEIIRCIESDLTDCRINAYPEFTKWEKHDMVRYPPNFIFIDLDLSNFQKYMDPKKMLDNTLQITLNKISQAFSDGYSQHTRHTQVKNENIVQKENHPALNEIIPTVLWSGNGYHIYLPIQAIVLDEYELFSKNRFPHLFLDYGSKYGGYSISEVFLLFAKNYFSNGNADPQHYPTYKTCLIRIPNTLNSKCLSRGLSDKESKVKIIQRWNGFRPAIQLLTKEFRRWLFQEEISQEVNKKSKRRSQIGNYSSSNNFQISWIEDLLQNGIPDGRKETLRLILGPYISKRNTYDRSIRILQNWIEMCDKVNPLDPGFNTSQRISNSLKNTKGFLNLDNLRIKYPWLYFAIQKGINVNKRQI